MNPKRVSQLIGDAEGVLDDLDGLDLPPHIREMCDELRRTADEVLALCKEEDE